MNYQDSVNFENYIILFSKLKKKYSNIYYKMSNPITIDNLISNL